MALRINKRWITALLLMASLSMAQSPMNQIQSLIKNLPYEILRYREMILNFLMKHQIHLFAAGIGIPLVILIYFDAKLFYRLLRDLTYVIVKRRELLPIEKKWYTWRISMKIIGIVILSASIIVVTGWIAWILQFKTMNEMLAALEELRKKQNPFQILETMLRSLRRR